MSYCVVGGGISGLVAALRLRRAVGPDATITVFDPADRLGGILRTERVGGQTMDIGESAFLIGMIGLVQFIPILVLSLFAGQAADRFDRKKILLVTLALEGASAVALAVLALDHDGPLWPIFIVAALFGAARSFMSPAINAVQPTLVPREHLPNAITLNTIMFQTASVVGPAAAGLVMAQKLTVQALGVVMLMRAGSVWKVSVADAAPVTAAVLTVPQPAETVGV